MMITALEGILIPLVGTSMGAACVFFMKKSMGAGARGLFTGFAAGVMLAASVWSLLLPAIRRSEELGMFSFLPAFLGFWAGILFFLFLDRERKGESTRKKDKVSSLVLAVVIHNIPEGMAVGAVFAGWLADPASISAAEAMALSVGIAVQNFPEGAIVSMPMRAAGKKRGRSFGYGVLSGLVEPVGALLTLLAAELILPALPYLLSFAAGAMIYVVIRELVPDFAEKRKGVPWGMLLFAAGFSLMMVLDVALG